MGIEPTCEAWKASVLPLNYTRSCQKSLVGPGPLSIARHESTRGHRKNCHKSAQKTQNGAAANKGWKIRMRTWPCASEELPRKDTKRTKQKGALSSAFL